MTASANVTTCGTCRFSQPGKKRGEAGQATIDFTKRLCRRYPPTTVMMAIMPNLTNSFLAILLLSLCFLGTGLSVFALPAYAGVVAVNRTAAINAAPNFGSVLRTLPVS